MLVQKRGRPSRKGDLHVLSLAMLLSTGPRRQLRRIFGLTISRPHPGTELESGIRAQVGRGMPPGVQPGIEDRTGVLHMDARGPPRVAILRVGTGDGGARRSWVSCMAGAT